MTPNGGKGRKRRSKLKKGEEVWERMVSLSLSAFCYLRGQSRKKGRIIGLERGNLEKRMSKGKLVLEETEQNENRKDEGREATGAEGSRKRRTGTKKQSNVREQRKIRKACIEDNHRVRRSWLCVLSFHTKRDGAFTLLLDVP